MQKKILRLRLRSAQDDIVRRFLLLFLGDRAANAANKPSKKLLNVILSEGSEVNGSKTFVLKSYISYRSNASRPQISQAARRVLRHSAAMPVRHRASHR